MEIVAVVAMTEDRIIATEDGVPWDYPEDIKQYKERVSGSPVIVGRATYQAMRPDLPGASQIVLSRSLDSIDSPTAVVAESVTDAVTVATNIGDDTTYVIGGGEIYHSLLEEYDRMAITIVENTVDPAAYDYVVYFPNWNKDQWALTATDDSFAGFRIEFWERVSSS
jgi:dihydrofolate reductase